MELFAQSYSLLLPKTHTWFPFQTESALHTLSKAHHSVFQSILFRQQTSQKLFLFLHLKKKNESFPCVHNVYMVSLVNYFHMLPTRPTDSAESPPLLMPGMTSHPRGQYPKGNVGQLCCVLHYP